ncbi:MAG TPA: hypothetical protein VMJ10_23980 [Kofleriaceae bacterium]|nr:hypothetical protein [Kofleriaceae bacterium]
MSDSLVVMRSSWGAIAIVLVACAKPGTGLSIDVWLDGADHAELLVGSGSDACGSACPGIGMPQDGMSPMAATPGVVIDLDSNTRLMAPSVDGHAHFELEAGTPNPISRLFVIGFDIDDNPNGEFAELRDVTIPANGPLEWKPKLARMSNLTAWREPTNALPDDPSCLHAQDDGDRDSAFYVPVQDHDCDGLKDGDPGECDAFWYLRKTVTTEACWSEQMTGSGSAATMACEAGTRTCSDGNGTACTPLDATICYPDAMCPCTGNVCECDGGVSTCVDPPPMGSLELQCMLYGLATTTGATVHAAECADTSVAFYLPFPCASVGVVTDPSPTGLSPQSAFSLTTQVPNVSVASGTMFTIDSYSSSNGYCQIAVSWQGSVTYDSSTPLPIPFDLVFGVAVGSNSTLVIPLQVSLTPTDIVGCGATGPVSCTLIGDPLASPRADGIWTCGQ